MILALALLGQLPSPEAETHVAVVVEAPRRSSYDPRTVQLRVLNDPDPECSWSATIADEAREAKVVWHFDNRVVMAMADLRPGVTVRLTGPSAWTAEKVEVCTLGPLAMEAAVEEFVIDASEGKAETALTPGEIATLEALGSRSWVVRSSVSKALAEKKGAALRLLCWGRHSRDPEVRERSMVLLRALGWSD